MVMMAFMAISLLLLYSSVGTAEQASTHLLQPNNDGTDRYSLIFDFGGNNMVQQ